MNSLVKVTLALFSVLGVSYVAKKVVAEKHRRDQQAEDDEKLHRSAEDLRDTWGAKFNNA